MCHLECLPLNSGESAGNLISNRSYWMPVILTLVSS
jgi:hypothetical protein